MLRCPLSTQPAGPPTRHLLHPNPWNSAFPPASVNRDCAKHFSKLLTSFLSPMLALKRLEQFMQRDEHWTGSLGLWIQILTLNQVTMQP